MELIKQLCEAFKRRVTERGGYGKGKKLDDAAMEFFVGATNVVLLRDGAESEQFRRLTSWIGFSLALRGYKAIEETLLYAALEVIAAGDMTRESMIETAQIAREMKESEDDETGDD